MSNKKTNCEKWSRRSSVHKGFKSPLISRASGQGQQSSGDDASGAPLSDAQRPSQRHTSSRSLDDEGRLQKDVDKLNQEMNDTEGQIQQLKDSGIDEAELAKYISKLHEYNDLKDIAQMIIGNIANIRGVRTRDLYPDYGLELDD